MKENSTVKPLHLVLILLTFVKLTYFSGVSGKSDDCYE